VFIKSHELFNSVDIKFTYYFWKVFLDKAKNGLDLASRKPFQIRDIRFGTGKDNFNEEFMST
jgi:hypothetical protein